MEASEALITTEDVAKYLNVDVVTIRRLVGRGDLAAYRIGGEYRFTNSDVRDYLQRQRIPARMGAMGKGWKEFIASGWTKRAKQALALAEQVARAGGQGAIAPAHILLGLISEHDGVAGHVLDKLGVTLEHVRILIPQTVEESIEPVSKQLGLNEASKAVLGHAFEEAKQLDHRFLGTEHLLLGLLQDDQIKQVLEQLHVSPEQVRARVMELLQSHGK